MRMPTPEHVLEAAARIRGAVTRTPVITSSALDALAGGASVYFKCENLQRVGAFKYRGATSAVRALSGAELARGVATHSSGNHAAALALAARVAGTHATVVMPENAPAVKKAAVEGYGARIVFCAPTLAAREAALRAVVAETGAHVVHPYDDPEVIAGQGTAALELLEEVPDLDLVLAPVGGGGLVAGTALAVRAVGARARVIATEPAGADDAARSFAAGQLFPSVEPRTVCDGLLTSLSERTFALLQSHVADVVTVPDAAIIDAMRTFWERTKLIIEPSAAVPVAALLTGIVGARGLRVGVVLSGGNADLGRLPWLP